MRAVEKPIKAENTPKPDPKPERKGNEKRPQKPRADRIDRVEQAEKLTVRSTSNTTAEKKAAADRAAKVQTAPQKNGEGKKPNPHNNAHRRPHRRPRGKGGNGGPKQGE